MGRGLDPVWVPQVWVTLQRDVLGDYLNTRFLKSTEPEMQESLKCPNSSYASRGGVGLASPSAGVWATPPPGGPLGQRLPTG